MTTTKRIAALVEPHGFVEHDEPGFAGFHRIHPDGRKQLLHVFFWGNPKHAEAKGIPHSYVVVVPTIDSETLPEEDGYYRSEDARVRINTKGIHGVPIAWEDAAAEFSELILPIFDEPVETGYDLLSKLEETHSLGS